MIEMCGSEIWMVLLLRRYMAVLEVVEDCELFSLLMKADSCEQLACIVL